MHKILFWVAITLLLLSGCGSNGEDADCAEGYQDNDADGVCELDCAHTDICGNYACDDSSGIATCECSYSEPESFRKYTGRIGDVYVVGNLAYTTYEVGSYSSSTSSGLHIFDISNAAAPNYVGSIAMPGQALKVVVSDQIAYVAGAESGLQIIDVSTPSSPVMQGTWETNDSVMAVAVVGGTAYVANGLAGLAIVDVSNREAPALLGKYDTTGFAVNVAVQEQTAFVADLHGGLQIVDVSDPTNPVLLDVYMMPDVESYPDSYSNNDGTGRAYDVAVIGNIVFVVDKYGPMQVVDVSNPADPVLLIAPPGSGEDIFISGTTAYLTNDSSLFITDISDPINPTFPKYYRTPNEIAGIFVQDQKAYIGNNRAGLNIVDVTDPSAPRSIGNIGILLSNTENIFIDNEVAYALDVQYREGDPEEAEYNIKDYTLKVLDISNPASPSVMSNYILQGNVESIFFSSKIAYAAISRIGLQIIDLSEPEIPVLLGEFEDRWYETENVFIFQNIAYYISNQGLLKLIDISNPSEPTLLSEFSTQGVSKDVFVTNDLAFIIDGYDKLQIVDTSNPSIPELVGTYNLPNDSLSIFVNDKTAFFACNEEGVNIVDVSDPSTPALIGEFYTNGRAVDIFVSEQTAYVADTVQGLLILDVSVPSDPVLLGKYNRGGTINKVFVSDGKVYVIDGEFGLDILEVMTCTCDEGFAGENCDECTEGYTGYPDCTNQ